MSAWNWVQLTVAIVVTVVSAAGKKMNKWVGFFMILGAGALMIVMSIVSGDLRFLPLGAWAIVGDVVGLIANAVLEGQGDDDTLGGAAARIPPVAWAVVAVLFVAAIAIGLFVLPAPVRRI